MKLQETIQSDLLHLLLDAEMNAAKIAVEDVDFTDSDVTILFGHNDKLAHLTLSSEEIDYLVELNHKDGVNDGFAWFSEVAFDRRNTTLYNEQLMFIKGYVFMHVRTLNIAA